MKTITYIIVYTISILWIIAGTSLVIYTDRTRKFIRQFSSPEHYILWSVIAIVLGVLLVVGSFFSGKIIWLAMFLGVISLAKGIYLMKGSPDQVERLITWWYERASEEATRFWGLATLLIGIFVLAYLL
ncbi:MAG TPA: hypothetical protein ENO00_04500 [Deltaproteobacteria bacterium]|nr:hypothetical protein [Deltaproteobacteria bacterium]